MIENKDTRLLSQYYYIVNNGKYPDSNFLKFYASCSNKDRTRIKNKYKMLANKILNTKGRKID